MALEYGGHLLVRVVVFRNFRSGLDRPIGERHSIGVHETAMVARDGFSLWEVV
jgi:hypothetical protein